MRQMLCSRNVDAKGGSDLTQPLRFCLPLAFKGSLCFLLPLQADTPAGLVLCGSLVESWLSWKCCSLLLTVSYSWIGCLFVLRISQSGQVSCTLEISKSVTCHLTALCSALHWHYHLHLISAHLLHGHTHAHTHTHTRSDVRRMLFTSARPSNLVGRLALPQARSRGDLVPRGCPHWLGHRPWGEPQGDEQRPPRARARKTARECHGSSGGPGGSQCGFRAGVLFEARAWASVGEGRACIARRRRAQDRAGAGEQAHKRARGMDATATPPLRWILYSEGSGRMARRGVTQESPGVAVPVVPGMVVADTDVRWVQRAWHRSIRLPPPAVGFPAWQGFLCPPRSPLFHRCRIGFTRIPFDCWPRRSHFGCTYG